MRSAAQGIKCSVKGSSDQCYCNALMLLEHNRQEIMIINKKTPLLLRCTEQEASQYLCTDLLDGLRSACLKPWFIL